MNRRSLGLAALYAGALLVGTIAGGAASVPSVYAKAAPIASQEESSATQAPAKKKPPIQCKTTKDCPEAHLCTKVGDHKECTPTAIKPPVAPVVT